MSNTPRIKKGKSSWQPASVTDVVNKEPGYRYRWSLKTPDNLAKKEAEGWETVSGVNVDSATPVDDGRINTGKNLTSTHERHDVVLQRIPEETALLRDAFYSKESERRVSGLTAHLKKDTGGKAPIHGNITIGSNRGTEVID